MHAFSHSKWSSQFCTTPIFREIGKENIDLKSRLNEVVFVFPQRYILRIGAASWCSVHKLVEKQMTSFYRPFRYLHLFANITFKNYSYVAL